MTVAAPDPDGPFDALCEARPDDSGVLRLVFPDGWQQGRGTFGGLVAAALARALERSAPGRPLRSLTAEICGPVQPGPATLVIEPLRAGSAVTTSAVRLLQGGEVQAHGVGVLGAARALTRPPVAAATAGAASAGAASADAASAGAATAGAATAGAATAGAATAGAATAGAATAGAATVIAPPSTMTPWRALTKLPVPPSLGAPFARYFEFWPSAGLPYLGATVPEVEGWIRPTHAGTRRDAAFLAACVDAYWPAILTLESQPRPMATIAFTLQPFARFDGLDPDAPLFFRGRLLAVDDGYVVEQRELWGEDGRLLALNQQTFVVIK